jgi:cell division cycle 14
MVLIQSWPPHLALAPIAQADPPLMPFRDAGYSQADYGITIQDVVYGIWRAKEEGVCQLPSFNLEEYERYERVDEGDFNWVTPDFLAFASPQHAPVAPVPVTSPMFATLPSTLEAVDAHPTLPPPFKNVLKHFSERNIGLVVRLNSELYCPSFFTALGIEHLDMIFDDGTCPTLSVVRKFITLAHETITVKGKGIAVHCKAGLGRTGCLIGAYLIYRYGFTASEIIAFMRFMRPGMVVGPQQHWLHLNQGTFRKWWVTEQVELEMRSKIEEEVRAKLLARDPTTPHKSSKRYHINSNGQIAATPPNGGQARRPLGEVDNERNSIGCQDDCLPAPTPGQPRKTGRADHHHPYSRSVSKHEPAEEDGVVEHETEVISIHRQSQGEEDAEEWQLRMKSSTRSSRSPNRSEKRTISQTTTAFYHSSIDNDSSNDVENIDALRPKTPSNLKSGSGSRILGMKIRASPKRSGDALRSEKPAGVRKTSGRVGSVGAGHSAREVGSRKGSIV